MLTDLLHGARRLLRTPAFTAVAVAALAIGIGANTAIFSVVNTLILQPLPYQDADRLAVVWEHNVPRDKRDNVVSPGNFLHWREMNQTFEEMAAVGLTFTVTVTGDGEPEELAMQYVTAPFFSILGVQPQLGRPFTAGEEKPDSRVAVISDRLWKNRYHADPSILSRPVTINAQPFTVVGVMPAGFSFMDRSVDVWLSPEFTEAARTPRGRWLQVVGRLKPDVTFARAQQDMTRVADEMARLFPAFDTGWTARVVPLREQLTGEIRPALVLLLGAVAFVLLIACANVANLLLVRTSARQRELAVRAALGAARGRLVRQLLAESAVLAVLGGAFGLLLAWFAVHLLRVAVAERLPVQRLEAVGLDGAVLAFTIAASMASGVFFGLVPALSASGAALTDALKDGGRGGSATRGKRARAAFVVIEVALALVLLVGAGLLVRSFMRLTNVNPGFDASHTLSLRVGLPMSAYRENDKRVQFYDRLFEQIDALPGVAASGGTSFFPLAAVGAATGFSVVGRPEPRPGEGPVCDVRVVANDYFKSLRVPLLTGRLFVENDPSENSHRVIVNEALARQYFPGENPIGRRLRISWGEDVEDEIVGVVGDVRQATLDKDARPTVYWPYGRLPYPTMTLAVRTVGEPLSMANSVVRLVHQLDPSLAVADIRTVDEVVSDSLAQQRVIMLLLTIFAVAALALAAVGIYGVISFSVSQRTQEIGIRMALGAGRAQVLRAIVGQALALAAIGIAIGAAAAFLLTRLMTGLLFDVTPDDPITFAAVAVVLAAVAAAASYVPGRRATRVDPVVALRAE